MSLMQGLLEQRYALSSRWVTTPHRRTVLRVACAMLIGAAVGMAIRPFMGLATTSYGLLVCGLGVRSRRQHGAFMAAAVALDVALVLMLAVGRDAVSTALGSSLTPMQTAHVAVSTLALVAYGPAVALGVMRLRGRGRDLGQAHRVVGAVTFALRTIGFVLMFTFLGRAGGV